VSPLPIDLGDGAILRRYTIDDLDAIYAAVDANRDRLDPWMPWTERTRSVDDQRVWLESVLADEKNTAGLGIFVSGAFAGGVGLHPGEHGIAAEIGYWITREYEGRGLMTKAVVALLGLAFDEMRLHRVYIRAAPENRRSRAIPERLGFVEEAVLREEARGSLAHGYHDLVVYGMLEDEWRARR
jgi:ribosomal-protein-serine acetyltransferase